MHVTVLKVSSQLEQMVVTIECAECGDQSVRFPVDVITQMCGQPLPCPTCLNESLTRVLLQMEGEEDDA